jgi:hypothetical protein
MKYLILFAFVFSSTAAHSADVPYWNGFSGILIHNLANQSSIKLDVQPIQSCSEESARIFKCTAESILTIEGKQYPSEKLTYLAPERLENSHVYYVRFALTAGSHKIPTTLIVAKNKDGDITGTRLIARSVDLKETILVNP